MAEAGRLTQPELLRRLDALGAAFAHDNGRRVVRFAVPPAAGEKAALAAAMAEHREAVECHLHPGRRCAECGTTLYVDRPEQVRLLCVRAMCPSFVERLWPEHAGRDRWFEQRRRDEQTQEQARTEEAIPD